MLGNKHTNQRLMATLGAQISEYIQVIASAFESHMCAHTPLYQRALLEALHSKQVLD